MSGAAPDESRAWDGQVLLAKHFAAPGAAYDVVAALVPAGLPCPGAGVSGANPFNDDMIAFYRLDHESQPQPGARFNPELGVLQRTVRLDDLQLALRHGAEAAWTALKLEKPLSSAPVLAAVAAWLAEVTRPPAPWGPRSRLSPLAEPRA